MARKAVFLVSNGHIDRSLVCKDLRDYNKMVEIEFSIPESEFNAENSPVTIIPNFRNEKLSLLSGEFGPFRPGMPLVVPLWLGVFLKKQQKCTLVAPSWMDIEVLKAKVQEERLLADSFSQVDFYYLEISSLILNHSKEDLKQSDVISRLIQDLYDLRNAKMKTLIKEISPDSVTLDLSNVSSIELQNVRRLLTSTFEGIRHLKHSGDN